MSNKVEGPERAAALVALYQAERSECSSVPTVALALVGAGAAYIVGTIAFIGSFHTLGWIAVSLLPLPLWLVSAYHSLLIGKAGVHEQSALLLEDILATHAGITHSDRRSIGIRAGSTVMNWRRASLAHKLANIITYTGMILIIFGYNAYLIISIIRESNNWIWPIIGIYAILAFSVTWSWVTSVRSVRATPADVKPGG